MNRSRRIWAWNTSPIGRTDLNTQDCIICHKHKNLSDYTGAILAEEDGLVLTHFPVIDGDKATRGHLLIEPRRHITDFSELTSAEAAAIGALAKRGSELIKSKFEAEHVYFYRINDKVAHLHFHLIPRYVGTPREFWGTRIMEYPDAPKVTLSEIRALVGH